MTRSRRTLTYRKRAVAVAAAIAVVAITGAQPATAAKSSTAECEVAPAGTTAPDVVDATPDRQMTAIWRGFGDAGGGWSNQGGWAASDGTYSTELPDGRVVWMLNDTFLGPVNGDESLPRDAGFVHNSFVLAGSNGFPQETLTAGTHKSPRSLVGPTVTAPPWDPSGTNDHWYWNTDGIVDGGDLVLFEARQAPTDGAPPFNFTWTGMDMAVFNASTLRLKRVVPTFDGDGVSWGDHLMSCGNYVYIYGGGPGGMHVARARSGQLASNKWQFYTGSGWSKDPTDAVAATSLNGAVVPIDGHFLLVGTPFNGKIFVATADSPVGPFTGRKDVYTAPETGTPGIYAPYNVAAHPEISRPGELLISYNVNTWAIDDIYADANNNRPRFIDLHLADSTQGGS